MESLVEEIIRSDIWTKIHSDSPVNEIISYLKEDNLDYKELEAFLDYLTDNYGIDKNILRPKFLVSIFMVSKFPSDIVGEKLEDKEQNIIDKATEIYEKFKSNNMENINKKLVTFKIMFDEWKKQDKYSQMNVLCEMYYKYTESLEEYEKDEEPTDEEIIDMHSNITDTMDDEAKGNFVLSLREKNKEEKTNVIKEINNMRNKILHSLKRLSPQYQLYLKNYKMKNVKYDETVYKHVYRKMKQVYWDNVKRDIFEIKNTDIYQHIINDYLELLEDIKITDLDTSILESYKEYDVSEDNLIDACVSLCKLIIKCNMQIDSENYDEVYEMLIKKLDNTPLYISDIFKLCFNRLETIKDIKITIQKKKSMDE